MQHELPAQIKTIIDLTSEFPACRFPVGVDYITCPTLDHTAPEVSSIRGLIETPREEPMYIHCAAGHGRSAVIAAALLIHRGIVKDVYAAEEMLRKLRPGVRMTNAQRTAVAQFIADRITNPSNTST
jgi:protein-tyrosine phosphatase